MTKHLLNDMENLNREILSLSSMVEEMIDKATRSLSEQRYELADEVIEADEVVDRLEVHVEEECLKMLALHQPVAIDLRRITSILKINNDMERIADLAVNVAERSRSLREYPNFPMPPDLERMESLATQMVRGAIDAFVNLDAQAARRILRMDDEVDRLNLEIINLLVERMQKSPDNVIPALFFFSATRHLERIADHATNIAEDVVYLVEGEIVRHKHGVASPVRQVPHGQR